MVTKKELLNRIAKLEEENSKLIKVVTDMNEKVVYLWKEDTYKGQEEAASLFDEWINGANEKVGEVNEV